MSDAQNGQALAVQQQRPQRIEILSATPLFDTAKFEHMFRIATMMAQVTTIPDHLCRDMTVDGKDKPLLHFDNIRANCFSVVNIAERWGIDPFAVAEGMSLVHGRRCFEGKLIAAVLDAKLGLRIVPEYNEGKGDDFGVTIHAFYPNGEPVTNPIDGTALTVEGSVGAWKTTGANSPWANAKNYRRMLMYRGTREWARLYRPAIMLGVYTDDEMDSLQDDVRARRAAPVQHVPITERLKQKQITAQEERGEGFSADQIRQTTAAAQQDNEAADGSPEKGDVSEEEALAVEALASQTRKVAADAVDQAADGLAKLAKGETKKTTKAKAAEEEEPAETLLDIARGQATNGKAAFEAWFNRLKPEQLDELAPQMRGLAAMAKAADEASSKVAAE